MLIAFKLKLALACAAGLAGPLAVAPLFSERFAGPGMRDHRRSWNCTPAACPIAPPATSPAPAGKRKRRWCRFASIGRCRSCSTRSAPPTTSVASMRPPAARSSRNVAIAIDRPAVQVSWHDAETYAAWLSRKTGERYRLPTDEEWAFAAGSKFGDDALPVDDNDPSKRWISRYEREVRARRRRQRSPCLRPFRRQRERPARSLGQCLGMDLYLLRAHRAGRCGQRDLERIPIAASASPRAGTAPMSPTSSATPAPAAARPACRRTISASGWCASSIHG